MGRLLHKLIALIMQKLVGRFVIIMVILLGVAWFQAEWAKLKEVQNEEKIIVGLLEDARRESKRISDEITARAPEWTKRKDALLQPLRVQLAEIDRELKVRAPFVAEKVKELTTVEGQNRLLQQAVNKARQERDNAWAQLQWHDYRWILGLGPNSAKRRTVYEVAEKAVKVAEEAVAANAAMQAKLREAIAAANLDSLITRRREKSAAIESVNASASKDEEELRAAADRNAKAIDSLNTSLKAKRDALANDPRQRAVNAVKAWVPTALWILAGMTIVPPSLKAFCYFVLAPLASRMKPICVLPIREAPSLPLTRESAVSMAFEIGVDEELLLHPDFLQSSSENAQKRTQAFLNPSILFSSIASGMWLLTRIRPQVGQTTRVVVSSQKDAFGEIGCIELPTGAAMVVHPRSLAGVMKHQGERVHITRHWRLFSVHAWLTFQLRYLVFHGPCKLLMKGCRGIRAEQPDENQPRMINRAITIGFSANLEYKNVRCEAFIPYLLGKEHLFNDLFSGESGVFVYEEIPEDARKGGVTGRWLEGMLDVVLKGFGV